MAFEEGHPKFGGRQKGTPNKSTTAARKLALAILGDLGEYAANARERIRAGKAPRLETKFLEYLFGAPRPVEVRDPLRDALDLQAGLEEDFDVGDAFVASTMRLRDQRVTRQRQQGPGVNRLSET